MFDKIARSWSLSMSSLDILRKDKKLIIFPIMSGLGCILVFAAFVAPLVISPELLNWLHQENAQGNGKDVPLWVYPVLFAFYFCNYFVIVFCNSALIGCAILRFNGEEATVGDGFRIAFSRLPQILAWALVSATVGLLLKAIENAHERVGQFISAILGTAWTVITFFVIPVLVVEKVGPIEAVKRSVSLLKKAWGEALVGHLGISLIMFLLLLPAILLGVLAFLAWGASPYLGGAILAVAVIYFLLWAAVGPTLNGIYTAVLYQYAAYQQVPAGFDANVLENAFGRKK